MAAAHEVIDLVDSEDDSPSANVAAVERAEEEEQRRSIMEMAAAANAR